jgi:hypothetical protein
MPKPDPKNQFLAAAVVSGVATVSIGRETHALDVSLLFYFIALMTSSGLFIDVLSSVVYPFF